MRRRFGRGRRNDSEAARRAAPIDAAQSIAQILAARATDAERLEPVELDGVPPAFAVVGVGENAAGRPVAVGFAPDRGANAAIAVLALGARRRRAGEPEASLFAIAPDWTSADRRCLALLAPRIPLAAVAASALAAGGVRVAPEPREPALCEPALLGGRLDRSSDREAFARALAGLEGLAAKHAGVVRGGSDRAELVLLARSAAALVAEPGAVRLEVLDPERATLPLSSPEGLATALDRLEGLLRKLLNDRKIRTSEPGLRAALQPVLERATELLASARWPSGGADGEVIDAVGLDGAGRVVVAAAREKLDLVALAQILDAVPAALAVARDLARRAGRPPSVGAPRLALAAVDFDGALLDVCAALGTDLALFDARTRRTGDWGLEPRSRPELGEIAAGPSFAAPAPARPAARPSVAQPAPPLQEETLAGSRSPQGREPARAPQSPSEPQASEDRPIGADSERAFDAAPDAEPRSGSARFEEVSLFDLDEDAPLSDAPATEGEGGRRRRRGRRRGRRGRGDGPRSDRPRAEDGGGRGEPDRSGSGPAESAAATSARAGFAQRAEGERRPSDEPEEGDDDDPLIEPDDESALAPLAPDVPEVEEPEPPSYEEDDEEADDTDPDAERARRAAEQRRSARVEKPVELPPPRRRAAFLAHADPISVLSAVVLARDVRLVESFWVYPQSDLMTFFRSVATDLRDETPMFLVGFAASPPARDTLQAASLYRGRLDWFDHHDWPPEDLVALRETLGADHVHVQPGAESSLAAVIAQRTRRSRFSDKLVELITGRFSQHDYERWGRYWWHRAGEIAARSGDRRADVEPLLAGRPSDLARDAVRAAEPPLPPELSYVSGRDFRLVHFGGLAMVVLEAPPELDLHLCARIARERYQSHLSLAMSPHRELVVLGGDETRFKRGLDLGGVTAHLAAKHRWIEALADDDHVARMRVHGLHREPGRLDELITEIAMGRSIVEG
jgi:hypothetical protein